MAMSTADRTQRAAGARWHPMRAVGHGPWRVLDECTARSHNTQRAARGIAACGVEAVICCICPRALALLDDFRKRESARLRAERANGKKQKPLGALFQNARYMNNVKTSLRAPDLSAGNCRTVRGRQLSDKVLTSGNTATAKNFKELLCYGGSSGMACPVLGACRDWVLRDETPRGDWKGVYGGLTEQERRTRR